MEAPWRGESWRAGDSVGRVDGRGRGCIIDKKMNVTRTEMVMVHSWKVGEIDNINSTEHLTSL